MNISSKKILDFQNKLLTWYNSNSRQFPWRNNSASNYQRIISEVLLQRTKAETVANFFPQFIKKYPSWKRLGAATQLELQQMLKPLGLYKQKGSRMYKLAQEMKKRKGRFPTSRADIEKIPMMGQYITNAYELFILRCPSPLLDVNMARVLERYFGPRKFADIRHDPYLQKLAKRIVSHPHPMKINWAILDFGAKICIARKPKCDCCPLNINCKYFKSSS